MPSCEGVSKHSRLTGFIKIPTPPYGRMGIFYYHSAALPRVARVCQNTTLFFASIHYAPYGAGRSMLRPYKPRSPAVRALRARRPWWRRGVEIINRAACRAELRGCVKTFTFNRLYKNPHSAIRQDGDFLLPQRGVAASCKGVSKHNTIFCIDSLCALRRRA